MTNNFGFKIVDKARESLGPILDYALEHRKPVEIGLYFAEPAALEVLADRLADSGLAINAHSDHRVCNVFGLDQQLAVLDAHIDQASALGSRYSIIHTAKHPMTPRRASRASMLGRLLDNLSLADPLCAARDYRLYLENTYHALDFYAGLFEGVRARGLRNIGFCFDIGHARVWSTESLEQWFGFLAELRGAGIGLHCHLHANGGLGDDHLSLMEAIDRGIDGPDDDYNPWGYPRGYWELERRFPDAVKVFEVKDTLAIDNLQQVEAGALQI